MGGGSEGSSEGDEDSDTAYSAWSFSDRESDRFSSFEEAASPDAASSGAASSDPPHANPRPHAASELPLEAWMAKRGAKFPHPWKVSCTLVHSCAEVMMKDWQLV